VQNFLNPALEFLNVLRDLSVPLTDPQKVSNNFRYFLADMIGSLAPLIEQVHLTFGQSLLIAYLIQVFLCNYHFILQVFDRRGQ